MARIQVSDDPSGRIIVSFRYDPLLVEKVKTIDGRRWQPAEKHWNFPNREDILEKILKVFEGDEVQIDPALEGTVPGLVVSAQSNDLRTISPHPPLSLRGDKGGLEPELPQKHDFQDLRRELVSRKYSYRTVKGYIYYNKDFINFINKDASEVNDNDIKDYLLYLAEEKKSSTSALNQAINALKFYPALLKKCGVYYGSMLKKKFVYEVRRPRKDKKLPVVLSQEEVAKILGVVENLKHRAILMLVYSAGLRVGEVVRLKPEDIDSNRMLIHIRGSKGRKDRYTPHFNS